MRTVPEWQGKTDDTPIPPRVKLRVKSRAHDCCENCGVRIRYGGQVDHVTALINGGENREANLRFLCRNCHTEKTKADVAIKSRAAKAQKRMAGFKKPSKFQNARSGKWKTKINGQTVARTLD